MTSAPYPTAAKGIVFERGAVWLYQNENDEWELPGSLVQDNEQPIEAVARTFKEELGFLVVPREAVYTQLHILQPSTHEKHQVFIATYLCELTTKLDVNPETLKEVDGIFTLYPISKIRTLNMPGFYKEAIEKAWAIEEQKAAI
jgi:8-oxo-dGTP pyrophosphatase MutT (NUDIX family)